MTRAPALGADEVHVVRLDLTAPAGADAWGLLSPDERARAMRLRSDVHRERFVASHAGLREVLARYACTMPESIRLAADAQGKPVLAGARLQFNLSHSATVALVAVALERAVGVDVERVERRRNVLALADRGLDPAEAAGVRAAAPEDRAAAFHRAWARREAAVKCTGMGLGGPSAAGPLQVVDLDVGTDYAAAVAVAGRAPARVRLVDRT
jgi:4'-phosphopantetheinyl transferase